MRAVLVSLGGLSVLALAACEPPADQVTYYEDVRPILAENCLGCHTDGGIAPFGLGTYEEARTVSERMMNATAARIMPPFLVDNSGDCGEYRDAAWLTDEEIETIAQWHRQSTPMGDPSTPEPEITARPVLDGDTVMLDPGVEYQPGGERDDDYRCFLVDPPGEGFVTGYQVHPGNSPIVHHVIVYAPSSASAGANAVALDEGEDGPGYTCFGGPRVDAAPVVLWAPGGGATNFPRGTGLELEPGTPLVMQIHYNRLAGDGPDHTTVDLEIAPSATPAYIVPIADPSFSLPPRMRSVSSSNEYSLSALPITVRAYGTFPHMHTRGTELTVERIDGDGAMSCMTDVPRWDFNWQLAYWYETPISITPEDTIRITCTWNTMTSDETITWGEGTQDEMCLNYFYVSL